MLSDVLIAQPLICDQWYRKAEKASTFKAAYLFLDSASQCYQDNIDWEGYVKCQNGFSTLYYQEGEFEKYKRSAFAILKVAEQKLSHDNPFYADAVNNVSGYYTAIGDYDASTSYIQKSLDIKKARNEPKIELATLYQNLGNEFKKKGDYRKATDYLKKALEFTIDSVPDKEVWKLAKLYDHLGLAYQKAGIIDSAIVYGEKAWEVISGIKTKQSKKLFKDSIQTLQHLSELYLKHEDLKKARLFIKKTLDLQKNDSAYRKYRTLELQGSLFLNEGKPKNALTAFRQAESIAQKFGKKFTPPLVASQSVLMADAQLKLGQPQEALKLYQRALNVLSPDTNLLTSFSNPPLENLVAKTIGLEILINKANTQWALYQSKKDTSFLWDALNTFDCTSQLITAIRQGIYTEESKNLLSERVTQVFESSIDAAFTAYQMTGKKEYAAKAFYFAESNKAQLLLEYVNEQIAKNSRSVPDSLLEKEKNIQLTITYFQKKILDNSTDENAIKVSREQIFNLNQELDQLTNFLEKNYFDYFKLKYQNDPISLKVLQSELKTNNHAMVEFFVGENAVYQFLISPSNGIQMRKIKDVEGLYPSLSIINALISSRPESDSIKVTYDRFVNHAFSLYDLLLKKTIEEVSLQRITDLIIIPDLQLNFLPFEILLQKKPEGIRPSYTSANLAYLFNNFNISYDYSATLFYRNQQPKKYKASHNFIGYAPTFGSSQVAISRSCTPDELYNLQCASTEVKSVGKMVKGHQRHQLEASTISFLSEVANYKIIHLATHACVDPSNSIHSKIFLSDNYLTLMDLQSLDLKADLAVLSACNTGTGKLIKGEGVMSLARGFFSAGCSSTLMSMWSVDDCATSDIMLRFYQELKRGKRKNEALRLAKLKYLEEAEKTHSHPYYWAAFVQFGNVDSISLFSNASFNNPLYYIIALLLFVGIGWMFYSRKW
jgi:CHAT domain-containing protein/Tfp pilus assembly protein PilF